MVNLSEITRDIIGTPYELGRHDCFSLVVGYLRRLGAKIPPNAKYKGLTFDNYKENYLRNPQVLDIAVEYLLKFCREIGVSKCIAGDILYLEDEQGRFLGIDGGNGKVVTAVVGREYETTKNCKRLKALRYG